MATHSSYFLPLAKCVEEVDEEPVLSRIDTASPQERGKRLAVRKTRLAEGRVGILIRL